MGLFKRRPSVDVADFEAVRAELGDVRAWVTAFERDKSLVDHRLGSLDATTEALSTRVGEIEGLGPRVDELHQQLAARLDQATADRATIESLEAQVRDLAAQIASIDSITLQLNQLNVRVLTQGDLGDHLARLDDLRRQVGEAQALADRVDVLETKITQHDDPVAPDLEPVHDRIDQLERRLAAHRAPDVDLRPIYARLDALDGRAGEPPPAPDFGDVYRRIAELEASVPDVASLDEICARLDTVGAQAQAAGEHGDVLDHRLASISAELSHQLAQLGDEVEQAAHAGRATGSDPATDAAISALRTTQIRLASEQARYEIAFREDLAALADQLRRAARS